MLQIAGSDWEENGKVLFIFTLLFIYSLFNSWQKHKQKIICQTST